MNFKQSLAHRFRRMLTRISPKLNTVVTYRAKFGRSPDLKNPVTLNEKILWLKFNDYRDNPLVRQCADKYRVREYIEKTGCGDILNELIAVYESVDDIEWDRMPDSFAVKLNVGCGFNIIVPDRSKLNIIEAESKLRKWMKTKYYLDYSEMQYKGVKPLILFEKYLRPKDGVLPEDYKFYCFDGEAPYVMVCTERNNRGVRPRYWYYNGQWEMQMLSEDALKYGTDAAIPKSEGIDEAFSYAKKLSRGFPFVRVDLYLIDGRVYFGELTFTPGGGFDQGRLPEADRLLGSFVKMP